MLSEINMFYPAHFWSNHLDEQLDELVGKKLVVGRREDEFHAEFLREMLDAKSMNDKLPPEERVKMGPAIPPIHLYNLLRRRIYLEPVLNDELKIDKFIFHVFDIEDDLPYAKYLSYVKAIFEFMTHHEIGYPFSINVYT